MLLHFYVCECVTNYSALILFMCFYRFFFLLLFFVAIFPIFFSESILHYYFYRWTLSHLLIFDVFCICEGVIVFVFVNLLSMKGFFFRGDYENRWISGVVSLIDTWNEWFRDLCLVSCEGWIIVLRHAWINAISSVHKKSNDI